MRITKDQLVGGYSALQVRAFLRTYRLSIFSISAAVQALDLTPKLASVFLCELRALGLAEPANSSGGDPDQVFQVSTAGQAFANASAAKPISRRTAERVLREFMERVHIVNLTEEYVYRVQSVVLFGSMLSSAERLGDVDVAVELRPSVAEDAKFEQRCDARRYAAQKQGRSFHTVFSWATWPKVEIMLQLKGRSRSLSLHEFDEIMQMNNVHYRVLVGDSVRIAGLIPRGRPA